VPRTNDIPVPLRPRLGRLARRLVLGLFLERWSPWAAASLLVAGVVALACRMFVPAAAPYLPWLWLAPVPAAAAALAASIARTYRPADLVAVADWLDGGHGMLLALFETGDPAWIESPGLARDFPLPRLRPWRSLRAVPAALAFLAAASWLPQRAAPPSTTILADDIAGRLTAAVVELKQQDLITPDEEKTLEEEIERIRRGAEQRMDASSWEAADALREKLAADVAAKQNALRWAEESLARYAAAAQGADGAPGSAAAAAELAAALEKLAQSGLLAGAAADLRRQLKGGTLPADPKALGELAAAVSKYLGEAGGRLGNVAALGKEAGRFDPSEFPLNHSSMSRDGDGDPGRGGVTRGRADAELTWGRETAPFDRFKAKPLPPGAARSADDWAPIVEMPGAPQASPETGAAAAAREYGAAAGQAAWRRTLAPRHQSAVKKYFAGMSRP
jgi:hypothetical protein